jgi:hypothetical protein
MHSLSRKDFKSPFANFLKCMMVSVVLLAMSAEDSGFNHGMGQ